MDKHVGSLMDNGRLLINEKIYIIFIQMVVKYTNISNLCSLSSEKVRLTNKTIISTGLINKTFRGGD